MHIYSDEAYHTRILLAALDHNMHLNRANVGGDQAQYHRIFRKRTKRWDVIPVWEQKAYSYIPELLGAICAYRYDMDQPLRLHLSGERAPSKTPIRPHPTQEIALAKKTRFASSGTE